MKRAFGNENLASNRSAGALLAVGVRHDDALLQPLGRRESLVCYTRRLVICLFQAEQRAARCTWGRLALPARGECQRPRQLDGAVLQLLRAELGPVADEAFARISWLERAPWVGAA